MTIWQQNESQVTVATLKTVKLHNLNTPGPTWSQYEK